MQKLFLANYVSWNTPICLCKLNTQSHNNLVASCASVVLCVQILSAGHDFLAICIWLLFKCLIALRELSQLKYPRRFPLRKLGSDYSDPRERPGVCNMEERKMNERTGKTGKACLYLVMYCIVRPIVYVFLVACQSEVDPKCRAICLHFSTC